MVQLTIVVIGMLVSAATGAFGQTLPPDSLFREFEVLVCDSKLGQINPNDMAIHQDGRVFIAAKQGLVIYDGERWELFRHPQDQNCNAVAVDATGRILVGFHTDFGILTQHEEGIYQLESLVDRFDFTTSPLSQCLRILSLQEKIFFGCTNGLAVWNPDAPEAFQYIPLDNAMTANSYWIAQDHLFLAGQLPNFDLQFLKYQDHDLQLHLALSQEERPKAYIVGGCEHSAGQQLIGTFNEGIYLLNENGIQPWTSEASEVARKIFVKGMCRCDDGTFAIVGDRGVVIADQDGRILDYLRSTEIEELGTCRHATYVASTKQLWIPTRSLGNAICFDMQSVNYRWRTRILGPHWASDGPAGSWIGGTGPIRFFSRDGRAEDFDVTQSLDFLETEQELLISSIQGLQIAKLDATANTSSSNPSEEETPESASKKATHLTPVPSVGSSRFLTTGEWLPGKTIALFGTISEGIHWYQREGESWKFGGHLVSAPAQCFDLQWEPIHQQLWFNTRDNFNRWQLARLTLDPAHPSNPGAIHYYPESVTRFDRCLAIWRGELLFLSSDGLHVYHSDTDRFSKWDLPFITASQGEQIEAMAVDSDEQLWIHLAGEGLYRIDRQGVIDLAYPALSGVSRIQCPENADHLFLISYQNGLVKIPRLRHSAPKELPKLNRLEAHPLPVPHASLFNTRGERPVGFLVEYAAKGHTLHPTAKYQYRILGWDPEWSSWSNENQQTLQSLPPGSYQFEVRCQSKSLQPGPVQAIGLFVPTPWYSQWWARFLAGMMLVGSMSAVISWRIRAERSRANQLEKKVQARTTELSQAKNELEDRVRSRTQDLEFANQELREQIAQRHQVEVHLHDSEQRYRTIVEGQSDMIVRLDRHGIINFANQAYGRHAVTDGTSVVGSLFSTEMDAPIASSLESWLRSADCAHAPITFRHSIVRNGKTVWEDWKIHALQDPCGTIVGFQGIGQDVTTLVKTQEDLRLKEEYLRHGSRLSMLGEMVANITHELRQPLGSISNFAFASEQSLLGVDTERARQLAKWNQQIVEQIARADSIVRRLRGFARRADAELEPCEVNLIVSDSLAMLQFELRRAEVEVNTHLDDDLPTIPFVRVQLEQVLVNLIRNACDAMLSVPSSERRLTISTSRQAKQVWVRVSDSGPGVPENQRPQIFEPFHTTKQDGLGLGLAISRSIVEDGGGKIWLEPSQGGATFVFTLTVDPHAV